MPAWILLERIILEGMLDLTPDMCKGADYFNAVQRGTLTLALTFGASHAHAIGMVCYGDFENIIRIDSERNAIYDIS